MAVLAGDSDLLRKLTESTSPLNAESINKQIGDCHNTLMLDACRGGNKVIVDRLASKVCLIVYKPQPLSREHLWNSGSLNLIMFNTYLYMTVSFYVLTDFSSNILSLGRGHLGKGLQQSRLCVYCSRRWKR